jgi:hypothetical protein
MRHGLLAAALVLTWARFGAAQDEPDEPKKEKKAAKKGAGKEEGEDKEGEGKKGGGLMEETADPASTEKGERGPYSPEGKTGELKEKDEEQAEAAGAVKDLPAPRKPIAVFGEVLVGFGQAATIGTQEQPDLTSLTFQVGGSYDFSKKFTLGLRVPWTMANGEYEPGQGSQSANAMGSPELFAELRLIQNPRTYIPLLFGVGIPVAQGNPDLTGTDTAGIRQWKINNMADAASVYHDGELFAPKRMPIVLGIGLKHRIGGELTQKNWPPGQDPPAGTVELKSFAIRNVTGVGASYAFLESPRLLAGLDLWMASQLVEQIDFTSAGGGSTGSIVQFALEPRLGAKFGAVSPYVGYVVPLGGKLGDSGVSGLRIGAVAEF